MLAPYLIGAVLIVMGLTLLLFRGPGLPIVSLFFISIGALIIWRYHAWLTGG